MKKLISAIMAAIMMSGAAIALADEAPVAIPDAMRSEDGIISIGNDAITDLDGDGTDDKISYEISTEDDTETYKLTVNDATLDIDVFSPIDALYVGRLNGANDAVYLLVGEYGPSDDSYSYIVRYNGKTLTNIGGIGALPEDIKINGNVLTASVRANSLQTWFRESDFVIASSFGFDADGNLADPQYYVAESPRASYALDTVVTVKQDITLKTSLYGEGEMQLKEGEVAVITASDDRSFIYVSPVDKAGHDYADGGYMMLGDDFSTLIVKGESVTAQDVFDGLIFAD